MRNTKRRLRKRSIVILFLLLLVLTACTAPSHKPSIEGIWETSANAITENGKGMNSDALVRYCFHADQSGSLITSYGQQSIQSDFTYSISESEIKINFGTDPVWCFQYELDGDNLILVQNNNTISYTRAKQ